MAVIKNPLRRNLSNHIAMHTSKLYTHIITTLLILFSFISLASVPLVLAEENPNSNWEL